MLRQLIKEMLLSEGMWSPQRLKDDGYKIVVTDQPSIRQMKILLRDNSGKFRGLVTIAKPNTYDGPCFNAWLIVQSHVADDLSGAGPLLYDIAMEFAGEDGLAPDRSKVSADARRVWDYYLSQRSDVEHEQLDDLYGTLTPMYSEDDCRQSSAYSEEDYVGGEPPDVEWPNVKLTAKDQPHLKDSFRDSALSKVYRKKGTPVLDALDKLRLIEYIM